MFKPCPNCGFLVALIAGREASQRCPRCGRGLLEDGEELSPAEREAMPARRPEARGRAVAAVDASAVSASPAATDPKAAATVVPASGTPPTPAPVDTPVSVETDVDTASDEAMPMRQPATAASTDATTAPANESTPSFAARRAARARRRERAWPWAVALPLLTLSLCLQLLLSQRAELSQDARWRPLLAATCGLFGCDVPAWREPGAFAMLARNVRPHASRVGVLHVTTSLRNDARWPQPLPTVVLSLSDLDGRALAARAVAPAEYSGQPRALVAPGDSVDIAFDVREPSPRVVSFDFQLR